MELWHQRMVLYVPQDNYTKLASGPSSRIRSSTDGPVMQGYKQRAAL